MSRLPDITTTLSKKLVLARVLLPVLCWIQLGEAVAQNQSTPNVVLVTIDTLRADRLGSYGYSLAKTPVLDQLASEYAGRLKIAKLNVDENPMTASQYGIQSIPTMLLFKSGKQVDSLVGALPKQEIERHIGTMR